MVIKTDASDMGADRISQQGDFRQGTDRCYTLTDADVEPLLSGRQRGFRTGVLLLARMLVYT